MQAKKGEVLQWHLYNKKTQQFQLKKFAAMDSVHSINEVCV